MWEGTTVTWPRGVHLLVYLGFTFVLVEMNKNGKGCLEIWQNHSMIKCSRFPNYKSIQWLDIVASEKNNIKEHILFFSHAAHLCWRLEKISSSQPFACPKATPWKKDEACACDGFHLEILERWRKAQLPQKDVFFTCFSYIPSFWMNWTNLGLLCVTPHLLRGRRWRHWGLRQHGLLVPLELPRYEAGPREARKLDGWHEKNSVLEGKVKEMEGVKY